MSKKYTQVRVENPAATLTGAEIFVVTQDGESVGTTVQEIADFTGGGGTYSAGNGLQLSSNEFSLGPLTTNTTITGPGNNLTYGSSGSRIGNLRVWSNGSIALDGSTSFLAQVDTNTVNITTTTVSVTSSGSVSIETPNTEIIINADGSISIDGDVGTEGQVPTSHGAAPVTWESPKKVVQVAFSDVSTAITTGTAKVTFRMPYAMTLTEVRCSLGTTQTSGSIFTVDINESGSSILSTKLTIDNTEKTSVTATTPAVISDSSLADDAEITIDVDQVGDGTAKQGIITLIGV